MLFAGYAWMHYPPGKEVLPQGLRSVGKYFPMEALLSKPFHIINAVDNDKTTFVLTTLPSGFGHDKSQAILPYRGLPNPPTLFFFGDGVSGAHPVLLPGEFCR